MAKKAKHAPLKFFDTISSKLAALLTFYRKNVSIISHFVLIVYKIYKDRNYSFLTSFSGYCLPLILLFSNYVLYSIQSSDDGFSLNNTNLTRELRLDSSVNLKRSKFLINLKKEDEFLEQLVKQFEQVCRFGELFLLKGNDSTEKAYNELKQEHGERLLGRLIIESRKNFTIQIDNYQMQSNYFHGFPFARDKFNFLHFKYGLNHTHLLHIHNCIVQSFLKLNKFDKVAFKITNLNELITLKWSFFHYLPLIISLGWLPNCLSIIGNKLNEQNSKIKKFYRICGLDMLIYHFAYTSYLFISLAFQVILFMIALQIIDLPYHYEVVLPKDDLIKFDRKMINSLVFLKIMIFYNLALAAHVQLFSLLFSSGSKKHFYFSFTIFTLFASLFPFTVLYTHLDVPLLITEQQRQFINIKFIIIYLTFLLSPNSALTYAFRQIEEMSYIEHSSDYNMERLQTFESISFFQLTINDIILIFQTYSIVGFILILVYEFGMNRIVEKLFFLDFFKMKHQKLHRLTIKGSKALVGLKNVYSQDVNESYSISDDDYLSFKDKLKNLNLIGRSNEVITIACDCRKSKECLFQTLLGQTTIKGDLFVNKYRSNSFTKPLFISNCPNSSIGFCFEDDLFYNKLTLEENLEIFSRLKSSQLLAKKSEIVLLIHLLKLKKVKSLTVNHLDQNTKRKLSVAIALLGNQHILILNDPIKNTDLETCKLIMETLDKLRYDRLIIIMSTVLDKSLIQCTDKLYILTDCELFYVGTIGNLTRLTGTGIDLIFRKLNKKFRIGNLKEFLNCYFGDREFNLVKGSKSNDYLTFHSSNLKLLDLINELKDTFNGLSSYLNVELKRIEVSQMKMGFVVPQPDTEPISYNHSNHLSCFKDLIKCFRVTIFPNALINYLNIFILILLMIYFSNAYELVNFFSADSSASNVGKDLNPLAKNELRAHNFTSSAIVDNLLVYLIESKRTNFYLKEPRISFRTDDLAAYINRTLNQELNTNQFVCISVEDSLQFVVKNKIDSILVDKHVGGIMKLESKAKTNDLIVNLVHNSHFPYLLLQIINLFTNFLIDHSNLSHKNMSNLNIFGENQFKINLQFNGNSALEYLYANLTNRIVSFFLLSVAFFLLSMILNQNLILYFNSKYSLIKQTKELKQISSSIYWIRNILGDHLTGILICSTVLIIFVYLGSKNLFSLLQFSLVFYILYFFILTTSLIFLFYLVYLSTNSLKAYLLINGQMCFMFGFAIPLIFSTLQYYLEDYYDNHKSAYSYFSILVYLNQLFSPIFNVVWLVDKVQSFAFDMKLCEHYSKVAYFKKTFCVGNMTEYNYALDLPLSTDRLYRCCTDSDQIYDYYLKDALAKSGLLLLINCILTALLLVFANGMNSIREQIKLKRS